MGPPDSALDAIQAHLSSLTAYPDPDYGELRTALGEALNVDPDWILPGNGSAELLTWAAWDLSKLEATYLVTPAFGDYWRALSAFGAKVLKCPLDLQLLDAEPVGRLVTDDLSVSNRSLVSPSFRLPVPLALNAERGFAPEQPPQSYGFAVC